MVVFKDVVVAFVVVELPVIVRLELIVDDACDTKPPLRSAVFVVVGARYPFASISQPWPNAVPPHELEVIALMPLPFRQLPTVKKVAPVPPWFTGRVTA